MSRSSTSTSSSSRPKPSISPPVSIVQPTLNNSELPSFGENAIDDFVLFPEDNAGASWNPADMGALPEFDENLDLSQFNFDVSGFNDFNYTAYPPPSLDPSLDFFDHPATGFQRDGSSAPNVSDQYGLDQWASAQGGELLISQDSGQLGSSWFGSIQSTESPRSQTTPSSEGMSSFAESFRPNGSSHPQISPSSSVSLPSAEVDWSLLESSLLASPGGDASSSSMNRRERRNIASSRSERARNAGIQQLIDSIPSAQAGESESFKVSELSERHPAGSLRPPLDSLFDSPSLGATSGGSLEYWGLENTHALVTEATHALKSTPAAYQPIFEELQRLRGVLEVVKSGHAERTPVLQQAMVSHVEQLTSQLQVLLTRIKNMLRSSRGSNGRTNRLDPEFHPDFLKESTIRTRRLISALCATINNLQTQDTGSGRSTAATNSPILSSGNRQVDLSSAHPAQSHPQDASVYLPDGSDVSLCSSSSGISLQGRGMHYTAIQQQISETFTNDVVDVQRRGITTLSSVSEANGLGDVAIATIAKPRYRLVTKPAFERLSLLVEGDTVAIYGVMLASLFVLNVRCPPLMVAKPWPLFVLIIFHFFTTSHTLVLTYLYRIFKQ
jgi:hypothetical protein